VAVPSPPAAERPAARRGFEPTDRFEERHVGPSEAEVGQMLDLLGYPSLEALVEATVPESIRLRRPLQLPAARGEHELIDELRALAGRNQVFRSFIGMGYHDCVTPPVVQRNVLENPGWYTAYTPYQAEIAQGRLEALLNFQTMVADLTALPLANASLLDEGTAAAEAMAMCHALDRGQRRVFYVSDGCHPQTIAVVKTRAASLGLEVRVGRAEEADLAAEGAFGLLLQYPTTDGRVRDYAELAARAHAAQALVVVATDLLALTLLRPPGEFGADVAVGSSQRFGVPLGFGGPHAAFLSTKDEYKRQIPGRIIGVSRDAEGRPAYRMALQTREQHIRREKATSNICTAQVLLAVMAGMYAVYHGPEGLRRIARRVHSLTAALARPCGRPASTSAARRSSTPCASGCRKAARGRSWRRRASGGSTCATSATARWAWRWTRPRPRATSRSCSRPSASARARASTRTRARSPRRSRGRRPSSPTTSSTPTTPSTRCCATCACWSPGTCRSRRR
jgi:glycine dehydrogenase